MVLHRATEGDPYPCLELRPRLRAMVVDHCRAMDVGLMAGDAGLNAWCAHFRSPARSAFEGPLPRGNFWRFSRIDLTNLTLGRIVRSIEEDWSGAHVRLFLAQPRKSWFPKLNGFERGLQRTSDSALFYRSLQRPPAPRA